MRKEIVLSYYEQYRRFCQRRRTISDRADGLQHFAGNDTPTGHYGRCPPVIARRGVFRLGFGISPEPADRRAEFALRRGEILCPEGECDVARESIFALGETGSNLKLRIYLGMF